MTQIDMPKQVRPGEELDIVKLESYLRDVLPGLDGAIEVRQFPSGYSNLTYLICFGQKEFILRRPPLGKKAKTAHDMKREYTILKALRPYFRYVPQPITYCEDPEVMDSAFYVMERIPGIILRKDFPKELAIDEKGARQLSENLMSVFCQLHGLDVRDCGLEGLGKPQDYVKRQVSGWSDRYRDARTEDVPDLEEVMAWLQANMVADDFRATVIHNDFKFDNVILNPSNPLEIIGVVDWEMATLGHPLMDLGASLAYWINRDDPVEFSAMRTLPTQEPGMPTRKEMVRIYEQFSGSRIEGFEFYYCFGLFRLAVIVQQIYYRYFHGQTRDERFKMFRFVVALLEKVCLRVISEGFF
jgi:aminoglycoside phosphotransferase (APT) family kinase protein